MTHSVQSAWLPPISLMPSRKGVAPPRWARILCSDLLASASCDGAQCRTWVHLPDALSEGIAPSDVTYFCVPNFWPRPRVSVPNVAPGFVDTTCCAGAGGVWTDSCRAAPPLAVRSGFSGVSVWTCYFGAPTEVVVKPSRSRGNPLFTEGARLSVPLAPTGTLGVPGCLLGGGHAKGPQDATAGILAQPDGR